MNKRTCLAGVLLALALPMSGAQTPAGPLTILVGGPPGTPGDTIARTLSEPLARELGRPVVVENRPGAAGTLSLAAVTRAAADGSVLGTFALQAAVAPHFIKAIPYEAGRDLVAIRQVSTVSNVLVVRADSPVQDLAGLVKEGRQGRLTYASGGTGTPAHLAAELLAQEAKLALQHVPFNGPVAALTALAGGHVDLMVATVPAALPLITAGKLRPLAVTSLQRLAALPEVPTMAELGHPAASVRDWHGLVAPAGTPPARIEQLAAALARVLAGDAVRQRLQGGGLEPVAQSGPGEFRRFIDGETERWGAVLRRAGVGTP